MTALDSVSLAWVSELMRVWRSLVSLSRHWLKVVLLTEMDGQFTACLISRRIHAVWQQVTHVSHARTHTHTHTWNAPSNTMDCVTDGYADGRRAQSVMSRSCCICHTAKLCWWCWWPAACELPVSCPARQPATLQMTQWPTGMWCATVLDQMELCSVTGAQTAPLHVGLDCILVAPNRTTLWAFAWRLDL